MNVPPPLLGIGKKSRRFLQKVLIETEGVLTSKKVAAILHVERSRANSLLFYWASRGWIQRIKHGVYVPVPLEAETSDRPLEDPWIVAEHIYSPCYLTGLTAAQYWDFTEQIIETITVFTQKYVRHSTMKIANVTYLIKRISKDKVFGLKKIWRESNLVYLADPSRTIVDLLANPPLGGGIINVDEMLLAYWNSEHLNREILLDYISKYKNKTIYKRLGFLIEFHKLNEQKLIEECRKNISKGNSQLDPSVKGKALSKRWGLWYPSYFRGARDS